ncbi:MAG: hypothetical protein Q8L24_02775 [bacterium]|nr:hypothetical protein [bacterium]
MDPIRNNESENKIYWSAPEFEYHEKTHVWFWTIALGMLLILAIAIWQSNFLFAFFAVIAGVLVLKWGKEKPAYLEFELGPGGIIMGGRHPHPWDEFSGFAMHRLHHEEEGLSEFVLKRKGKLGTHWKVLVPNKDTERVRHFTNQYLPEIEFEDSFVEHISRLMKF